MFKLKSPKRYILNNGLRTLLIPLPKNNLVTIGIFIKTGSRNETPDTNGIAHFLEHMMFKGTRENSGIRIAEKLDSVGAHYNAMTTKEYTGYYISGNGQDLKLFIEIIIDLYCNPLFLPKDIEKEKNVIIEELNMNLNDPASILMARIHSKLFSSNSLGMPIIGTVDTIQNMSRKDFIDFRKDHYTPSNSIMVLSGYFNTDKIIKLVNKEFNKSYSKIIETSSSHPIIKCDIVQQVPYVYLKESSTIAQTHVMIAFYTVAIKHPYFTALDLVSDILSSGSSSRLFHALRTKLGVTYFNHSYNLGYNDTGLFIIHVGVDNGRVMEVIDCIINEIRKLLRNGITDSELKKAKKIRKTTTLMTLQNPKDFVFFYGLEELFDPLEKFMKNKNKNSILEAYTDYDKITVKDVNSIIRKIFTYNNFNLFAYGNVSSVKKNLNHLESKIETLNT